MTDELHAPWDVELSAAELKAALEHALRLLEDRKFAGAVKFLRGVLRARQVPRHDGSDELTDIGLSYRDVDAALRAPTNPLPVGG